MMNIRDPALSTELPGQDVPNHDAVVVLRLLRLARQVLDLVALGQL